MKFINSNQEYLCRIESTVHIIIYAVRRMQRWGEWNRICLADTFYLDKIKNGPETNMKRVNL